MFSEFRIMRKLSHRNVVAVYDLLQREAEPFPPHQMTSPEANGQDREVEASSQPVSVMIKPAKLYLLMEYCVCGLFDLLENNAPNKRLPIWQAHG